MDGSTPAIADMKAEYHLRAGTERAHHGGLCLQQQRRGQRLIPAVLRTLAPLFLKDAIRFIRLSVGKPVSSYKIRSCKYIPV